MSRRLIIASNRLPFTIRETDQGIVLRQSVGGLTRGLQAFYDAYESYWIGWSGMPSGQLTAKEEKRIQKELVKTHNSYPLFLDELDIDHYYHGFCNKTLWPLFHCFTQYAEYEKSYFESYERVNRQFCDEVLKVARPGDIIWVHDYHLMLLPQMLREKLPDAQIGFFLHIPFPPLDIFNALPWRKELLEGVLQSDLIGFHTFEYVGDFLTTVSRLLGFDHAQSRIDNGDRLVKVDAFPMGIDFKRFYNASDDIAVKREAKLIKSRLSGEKIILSVDRLDYTKGILQRLEGFDAFLDKHPEYREKVTLVLVAVPSRTEIDHYQEMRRQVDEKLGQINGKYGVIGWMPVHYMYRAVPFSVLTALYAVSDVALVTPLKDGMNLIAKEFVAAKKNGKGVLILSEMAGAAKELSEAITVNPHDTEDLVEALETALAMPLERQKKANRIMQKRLRKYDVEAWAEDFIATLAGVKKAQAKRTAKKLSPSVRSQLIKQYTEASRRSILLDYDGTLVSFTENPEQAAPDAAVISLLNNLLSDPRNQVVVISGRGRQILDKWLGKLHITLIAEHGAWVRPRGKHWKAAEGNDQQVEWKQEIMPILEHYLERTPGALIEEKDSALVWHYRQVEPELAARRTSEVKEAIKHYTANLNIGMLEGNKVVEIRKTTVDKGQAALKLLSRKGQWGFILAIGDDLTDEDMFRVMPKQAYTIKVGEGSSEARFSLSSVQQVHELLQLLGQKSCAD